MTELSTITIDKQVILSDSINARNIHGSLIYNGYIYGSWRSAWVESQTSRLTKILLSNIESYSQIPIYLHSDNTGESLYFDQIVECNGYLWMLGTEDLYTNPNNAGVYLIMFNPIDDSYKTFKLSTSFNWGEPIVTDGTHLYLSYNYNTYKTLTDEFIAAENQFNTTEIFNYTVVATYDHTSQGGYILGNYDSKAKGRIHSACVDDTYLYLAFTTGISPYTDANGYLSSTGLSYFELHKVNRETMLADSWSFIPSATDDMAQNDTHLFFGIEMTSNANVNTYGYGWGNYAVRKSDLNITSLPKLFSTSNTPIDSSYGVFLIGNYLVDIKANRYLYVLDISDVDNWSLDEEFGLRTIGAYDYKYNDIQLGYPINELLKDGDTFYGFVWTTPSQIVQFQITDFDWVTSTTPLKIYLGETNIIKAQYSDSSISKIYLGETQLI